MRVNHQYRQVRRKHNESFQIFRSWIRGNIICFNAGGLRLKFLIFQVDQKDLELDGRRLPSILTFSPGLKMPMPS